MYLLTMQHGKKISFTWKSWNMVVIAKQLTIDTNQVHNEGMMHPITP